MGRFDDSVKPPLRPGMPWLQLLQRVWVDEGPWTRPSLEAAVLASAAPSSPAADSRRVLVVDDNPVNLMLASEMLSSFSVIPVVAADGGEAVALAAELRLDLILMDLQMPVLDGLAATRQIREHELASQLARLPVVAYSSAAPSLEMLKRFGIDDVLDKPCGAPALRDCLQRWCPNVPVVALQRVPLREWRV